MNGLKMFGFRKKTQDHIRTLAQEDGIIILFYKDKFSETIINKHMLENSKAVKEMFGEHFSMSKWKANRKFGQSFLDEISETIRSKTTLIHLKNKLPYTYASEGISKNNPCWVVSPAFSVGKDIARVKTELNEVSKQKSSILSCLFC